MAPFDRLLLAHGLLQVLRLGFTAVLFLSLLVVGRLVAKPFFGEAVAAVPRALAELGLGFAAYSTVVRLAAAAGLATRGVVLGLLLVPAAFALRRRELVRLPGGAPFGLGPALRRLATFAVALLPLPMTLAPAVSFDALTYQLRMPEVTLRTGHWPLDPANTPTFFPGATQCLYLPALAFDPSGVTAQLVHYGFFLLTLVALAALAGRLGAGPGAWWSPLLFASIPAAGIVAGWSWADMPLCFALVTAALALTCEGWEAGALALLGLAASIKYNGLVLALPLGVAILVLVRRRRSAGARLVPGAAAALAVMAPWYAANALATGNPVFPLLHSVFGGAAGSESNLLHWSAGGRASGAGAWWRYVLAPDTLDGDLGGPALCALLGAALVHALRQRGLRAPAVVVLAAAAVLSPFQPAPRVLLPVLAGACALAAVALADWTGSRGRAWLRIAVLALVLRGGALVAAHNALFFNPLPVAVGIESPGAYVARNFPPSALFARAGEALPPEAVVLSVGEPRVYGFPRPTVTSAVTDPPAVQRFLEGAEGPGEAARRLRASGITHLLVALDWLSRPGDSPSSQAALRLSPAESDAVRRLIEASTPVDREGPLLLVALPPS